MAIDWKKGPKVNKVDKISLPPYNVHYLDNGIKVIELNQGTQEVVKFDIIYRGARILEEKKLTAKFTASLMREGTSSFSSSQLAYKLDFYGAVLRTASNLDFNYLSLSCLSKYFEELCPILSEIINEPSFLDSELEKMKRTTIQKVAMDLSKNEILSYRILTEELFGKDDPYGYNTEKELIQDLSRNDIVSYFENNIGSSNCFIVIGGKFDSRFLQVINKYFGQIKKDVRPVVYNQAILPQSGYQRIMLTKNEFQASIKLGRRMFNRHHEDYPAFFVLNTILGGYFGSRLMSNIREKHGYTYNIYSGIDHLIYDGYFYIGTEVSTDLIDKTVKAIGKQVNILKDNKIKKGELEMVRSYLMGNFLNLVDGPLNSASLVRSLELDGCLDTEFDRFIEEIVHIDADRLLNLAQKYLSFEDMITVTVTHKG